MDLCRLGETKGSLLSIRAFGLTGYVSGLGTLLYPLKTGFFFCVLQDTLEVCIVAFVVKYAEIASTFYITMFHKMYFGHV